MSSQSKQAGISLLEVVVSIPILVIGILALLTAASNALTTVRLTQEDLIAKQKAREALESVYTARSTQQITFAMIQNVGGGGIFLDGPQVVADPGADGLVNTADDGAVERMFLPGPDGNLGTADDVVFPLSNYSREIQISNIVNADGTVNPDLRQIDVIMSYRLPNGAQRRYSIRTYVSRYS